MSPTYRQALRGKPAAERRKIARVLGANQDPERSSARQWYASAGAAQPPTPDNIESMRAKANDVPCDVTREMGQLIIIALLGRNLGPWVAARWSGNRMQPPKHLRSQVSRAWAKLQRVFNKRPL